MVDSSKINSNFLFVASTLVSVFLILGIYVKVFEIAWNEVIPPLFQLKSLSFVESMSLIFVLFTVGMLLMSRTNVSLSLRKS
jgi:hypothetical protein